MHVTNPSRLAIAVLTLAALTACGEATLDPTPPAGTAVAVAVDPSSPSVAAAGTVAFAATVTGTVNTSVTWSIQEQAGGSVDATGRYVAPSNGGGVFHVTATSVADPRASATATVTVTPPPPPPIVVAVSPATSALDACQPLTLAATVTGTTNSAVTWSVQEGAAGGAVTAAGVYTAPATAGTYHVTAKSVADPTKSATATITVTERVLSVSVSPATVTVPAGGTTRFTATVTTTCGTFASAATVDATGRVVAN